jgi:outer membrane receptor protein involved in Fe transport
VRLPGLTFTNYLTGGQIGNVTNFDQWNMIHEPAVNITKVISSHTIRSGLSYRVYMRNGFSQGAASGAFSFNSTYTGGPLSTSSAAPIGQDFASFLLGIPASGSAAINTSFATLQSSWAIYAMDDWKLGPKLTVTAGVRYELPSALTERYNRSVAAFDPSAQIAIASQVKSNYQQNPPSGVPALNVQGGLTFPGVGGVPRELWQRSMRNIMPRVGFAYSVTPKTVVRASYGVFRESLGIPSMTANQTPVPETGFQSTTAFVPTLNNGQTYVATLTNPFPNGLTEPVGSALGASTNLGQTIQAFNPHLTNPYVQTWELGLQRELPFNSVIEVDYVGNRGTHMRVLQDLNPVPAAALSTSTSRDQATINYLGAQVPNPFYPLLPGTNLSGTTVARAQLLRPYPQFATSAPPESGNGSQQIVSSALSSGVATTGIQEEVNAGYSWYHALQASIQKRYSSGLAATYSFTWAKGMQAITYKNVSDIKPERVISDLDRPIRNTIMVNYELPFGRGKKWATDARGPLNAVIGGWQVNGVYTYQSGQGLTFGNAIMTCSPGQVKMTSNQRSVKKWFNTSCFNTNSAQQLQWNLQTLPSRFSGIRGPVVNNVDFSAMKFFQLTEKMRFSLTGQGINVLNHPQFQPPNTSPTSTAFGSITTQYSWQRIVEVSARLEF